MTVDAPPAPDDVTVIGSVNHTSHDVDHSGNLRVTGHIIAGRKVRVSGNLEVEGVVESAHVDVTGNLRADGGISGRDRGICKCGGNLAAKYIANATVEAVGDVVVGTEIIHSHLICGGQLTVSEGSLVAGETTAAQGIICKRLGSIGSVLTVVTVGVDGAFDREVASQLQLFESRRKKVHNVRKTVGPLMQNLKALTAQQKEKATELLFEADELEAENARVVEELRKLHEKALQRCKSEIHVLVGINPPVQIKMHGIEATIQTPFRGPLTIRTRGSGCNLQIILAADGKEPFPLKYRLVPDVTSTALRELDKPL